MSSATGRGSGKGRGFPTPERSPVECPPPPGSPTLADELRRGVNPYNLKFGGVAAVALGAGSGWLAGSWRMGALAAGVLFLLLTALHTLAHGLMGFLFERGLAAHCRGDWATAARWLALADKPGMDHYDPQGVARAALRESRARRQVSGCSVETAEEPRSGGR